jgi:transcriptional regulator with XRE-family HTH domain
MTRLAQQLRHIRLHAGLTQDQVAAHIGVSASAVRRWELGHAMPHAHHIIAYATLLNRRIMVALGHTGIHDLADVLADLPRFRKAHRHTREQIADRMHVTVYTVTAIEHADTKTLGLHTLERYFAAGYGYRLGIARVEAVSVPC